MHTSTSGPENWFATFENGSEKFECCDAAVLGSIKAFSEKVRNIVSHGQNRSLKGLQGEYGSHRSFLVQNNGLKGKLLGDFHAEEKLAIRPNLDWYVDSSAEAYEESLGLNIPKFLAEFSDKEQQQTVLELGAGNGHFLEKLRSGLPGYDMYGISDVLYYKADALFKNIVQTLLSDEGAGHPFSSDEIAHAAGILQKAIFFNMDMDGNVELEDGLIRRVQTNPESVFEILNDNADRIQDLSHYPSDDTFFDPEHGRILHDRIPVPLKTQNLLMLLSRIIKTYDFGRLKDANIFEHIDAYPFGIISSDFTDLKNLADRELDFVFGRFSTVYIKSGPPYIDFLKTVEKKLSMDGLYIDNGIRQNYGVGYRLAEAQEAAAAMDAEVFICMGNGEARKDGADRTVPRSVVISNSSEKIDYLRKNAPDGYSFVPVGEVDPEDYPKPSDSRAQWNARDRLSENS